MTALLLIVIYIAFIGLGIPDSLFGTAWPAIYPDFQVPLSSASCVTLLISGGTIVSSLCSAALINRFGTEKITAASTSATALALLGFSLSPNLVTMCLCAIPLGLGAGAIDTALNNYVALHYKATHMNFLHCFYGIGISISPYLLSLSMSGGRGWRSGYRVAFLLQTGIAVLTILSIPVWKKAAEGRPAVPGEEAPQTLSLKQLSGMKNVRLAWLIFIGSCAIECCCGTWGSTFLVSHKGLPVDIAAGTITFYYVGIALGRFLSGILSSRLSGWKIIRLGQAAVAAAILLLFLPLPGVFSGACFFLIGLGNGPVFPNMIHLTPINFGAELSQSVMGSQMAASYVGIMLAPALFGLLGQRFGMFLLPFYLLAFFLLLLFSTQRLYQSCRGGKAAA